MQLEIQHYIMTIFIYSIVICKSENTLNYFLKSNLSKAMYYMVYQAANKNFT